MKRRADGGRDNTWSFVSGPFCARPAESQEGSAGTALASVCEDASRVSSDASRVMLRSCKPAPMHTCFRLSRKLEAHEHERAPREEAPCACQKTRREEGDSQSQAAQSVRAEILGALAAGKARHHRTHDRRAGFGGGRGNATVAARRYRSARRGRALHGRRGAPQPGRG